MQISPVVQSTVFGVLTGAFVVAGVVAHFTPEMFPSWVSASEATDIIKIAAILGGVASAFGLTSGLYSSPHAGPWASAPPAIPEVGGIVGPKGSPTPPTK